MSTALKAFSTAPFDVRILSVPGAVFTVRRLGNKRLKELRVQHTTKSFDRRSHAPVEKLDLEAFFDAKAEEQITGWNDLEIQGEPIPFSRENLLGLCEFHYGIVAEVMAEAERVDPMLAEEREKNLSTGANGSSTE
ncbi:hypothetical protein JCM15519_06870 [Fundidesulfovibrio butyratiphilus]